jgi:hypothetical protein
MSGASHTPGPWFVGPSLEPDGNCLAAPVMGLDAFVAHVLFDDEGDSEATANARLIAAAPDMLEALEAWHLYDSRDDSGPNAGVQMMLDYDRALTLTRAAIAKARGQ